MEIGLGFSMSVGQTVWASLSISLNYVLIFLSILLYTCLFYHLNFLNRVHGCRLLQGVDSRVHCDLHPAAAGQHLPHRYHRVSVLIVFCLLILNSNTVNDTLLHLKGTGKLYVFFNMVHRQLWHPDCEIVQCNNNCSTRFVGVIFGPVWKVNEFGKGTSRL